MGEFSWIDVGVQEGQTWEGHDWTKNVEVQRHHKPEEKKNSPPQEKAYGKEMQIVNGIREDFEI